MMMPASQSFLLSTYSHSCMLIYPYFVVVVFKILDVFSAGDYQTNLMHSCFFPECD